MAGFLTFIGAGGYYLLSKVHIIQCTVYTVQYILYSIQCTLYTVQYILYSIYCTVYSVHYILYGIQCTVYSVQQIVYRIKGILVYSLWCTVYTVHWGTIICLQTRQVQTAWCWGRHLQIYSQETYSNTQIHRFTNTQVHKHKNTSTQIQKNIHKFKYKLNTGLDGLTLYTTNWSCKTSKGWAERCGCCVILLSR